MDGTEKVCFVGLQDGDVLHGSWGYDMTHADFFVVLKGAPIGKFARIAKLANVETSTGYLCGTAVPAVPYQVVGKVLTKKVKGSAYYRVCVKIEDYEHAYPWDENPKHFNYCD